MNAGLSACQITAAGRLESLASAMLRMSLFLETLLESLQIVSVNVGNGPVIEVGVSPMQKLIALARHCLRSFGRVRFYRPNKQVNKMLPSLIDQRRHRPVIEIIEAASNQRKSFVGKVRHGRRKIELGVQPRFHRVLVGGSDIGEMVRHY